MSNLTTKDFFAQKNVQEKFGQLLGKRSASFITSVLQIVNSNDMLRNADPQSVYTAAATAATLDLPLNNSLGLAYIVPFNDRKSGKQLAQFQLGYKAYIQLAQRSGQYKTINVTDVREDEIEYEDFLSGEIQFKWQPRNERIERPVIGYVAYIELLNGFRKSIYMSKEELEKHGKKFSQTYKKGFGLWQDDFDSMAKKTVIKMLLSKFGILSVDMQTAVIADQSVIKNSDTLEVQYIDNEPVTADEIALEKEIERCKQFIDSATTKQQLKDVEGSVNDLGLRDYYEAKLSQL